MKNTTRKAQDMQDRNIVLVGFMGTGKTAVANMLATMTDMKLVEMDAVIEKTAGKPITQIFAEDGEAAFRKIEHNLAATLSTPEASIISTGGGVVLNPDNIRLLSEGGLVVCLQASVDEILRRVENDMDRPLLQTNDRKGKVLALLSQRQKLYDNIPFQILTDGRSVENIAQEILAKYRSDPHKQL
jgi:shikimate kinase